jgi:multidrug efflux pump subunit AcrA (membrane-fusion protein)
MSDPATLPWVRRPELVVRPVGDNGQHVVKNPSTGEYFSVGEQEAFLLLALDGHRSAADLCAAFGARFGEPFSEADLQDFLEVACAQGLVQPLDRAAGGGPEALSTSAVSAGGEPPPAPSPARPRQSILYWRKRVFDPDRFLKRLGPWLGFCYAWTFLVLTLGAMAAAAVVLWANRQELAGSFANAWRWQTVVLVWLALLAITTCHEFAHGLTCKRFGGEVHEVGFLLLFFFPCLYCNVSDAWLFKEKSKRLLVTLAGGYCDLCLWALAVFAWRLTLPTTFPNYLAFVLLSVLGLRVFFNFNPLLKLDGYYLLSDLAGVPNLQQWGLELFKAHVRWLLWGAPRPAPMPRSRFLLAYGVACWLFSLGYLTATLVLVLPVVARFVGWVGVFGVLLLGGVIMRNFFRGLLGGEFRKMLLRRHKRALFWGTALTAMVLVLVLVRAEDRAGGPFQLRPVVRAEVRAPVAGFLREVYQGEGGRVARGAALARLEVPNLATRITQKRAEAREVEARLRLLEAGPRPEELKAGKRRLERARHCYELAERDLARARRTLGEDLARLDGLIGQQAAELDYAAEVRDRARTLLSKHAIAEEQYQEAEKKWRACSAQLKQAQAQRRCRKEEGTRAARAELARRGKEVAEAETALALLEAGYRPEEVEEQRAHLARVREEVNYLKGLRDKTLVSSPVAGLVTTPHLTDKVGQYVQQGEVICVVEDPSVLEAEIALTDQEVARVRVGQEVELKARTWPFQWFRAKVDRIAPRAVRGEVHSTVTVYSRIDGAGEELRPGMIGRARIACGRRPLGAIWADRVLRFLRTEFWW